MRGKFVLAALTATMVWGCAMGQNLKPNIMNERLNYDVMFKWGIIEKTAGEVNLLTAPEDDSDFFMSVLTGRSVDLADNIYTVNDTLRGKISKLTMEPVNYERIAHEGGGFYKNNVNYYKDEAGNFNGEATSYSLGADGNEKHGQKLMTATGITLDMLSSLYFARYLDYEGMMPGDSVQFNIFTGNNQQQLQLNYVGPTQIEVPYLNDVKDVYEVSFTFTYADKGNTKTSSPIVAWVSMDEQRVPYQLDGKLPIGGIRCQLSSMEIEE